MHIDEKTHYWHEYGMGVIVAYRSDLGEQMRHLAELAASYGTGILGFLQRAERAITFQNECVRLGLEPKTFPQEGGGDAE